MHMQHRLKCKKKENNLDDIHDICCIGIEPGGEITMEHETKLIDVSEQHSIDKVGTCEASRFDSISNRTSDSGFDS